MAGAARRRLLRLGLESCLQQRFCAEPQLHSAFPWLFFHLHTCALLPAYFCWMAFCAWVFFPFSPFSISLVKSNCNSLRRGSPVPMPLHNAELVINTGARWWRAGQLTPCPVIHTVHDCSRSQVHVLSSAASTQCHLELLLGYKTQVGFR